MEGYFPGVSRVRVITPSLGRLQDLITGPGPITVIFSRLVTVSAKSMSLLFTYNVLRRQLCTWQIQWVCLQEEWWQSWGPCTRVRSGAGGGGVLRCPLLCPTRGDMQLREATASPQICLRTRCPCSASNPATCQASPSTSSQPSPLATSSTVSSLPAVLLLLPASPGKPSRWQTHTLTLRPVGNWQNHA